MFKQTRGKYKWNCITKQVQGVEYQEELITSLPTPPQRMCIKHAPKHLKFEHTRLPKLFPFLP